MKAVQEPLARFATERSKLKALQRLFSPNQNLVLSVFRIEKLNHEEIKKIGVEVVRQHAAARNLHGWAVLPMSAVREVGLQIENDDKPPRHSIIKGWPESAEDRNNLSQKLAKKAYLVKLESKIKVK